jgi:hypothetical protein
MKLEGMGELTIFEKFWEQRITLRTLLDNDNFLPILHL